MRSPICLALFCLVVALAVRTASAQLIDFETTPAGGTPTDDASLAVPYNLTGGGTVRFFFDNTLDNTFNGGDTLPVFEHIGADGNDGFTNNSLSLPDTASPGYESELGTYFLRQLQPGTPPPPFIVDYNTSQVISALHGEIWDIDGSPSGTEQWLVEVLDGSNAVLASQTSPLGNSAALDGLPWVFSFSGLPAGVDKVRITFTGTKTTGLGLAFNNFDPTNAVPEPGTLTTLLGVGSLLRRRRRRSC